MANRLISSLLGVPLHDYGCTLKAYRREVIEDVRLYGEMHRFIPIYAAWEGARVTELPVGHHPASVRQIEIRVRPNRPGLARPVTLYFIDRAFDRPMQFFGKLGLAFWGLGLLTFVWALVLKFGYDISLIQTPLPLLAATIGLSGVLFILLGIIAEVQARIYFEARGKPPYKVKSIVEHSADLRPTRIGRHGGESMCGIAGFTDPGPDARRILGAMNAALAHRGPDGNGIFVDRGIALGHTRLAIIDLAGGAQPRVDEATGDALVFNGEIYGYRALADELRALGSRRCATAPIPKCCSS